jgi:hypothetical protein
VLSGGNSGNDTPIYGIGTGSTNQSKLRAFIRSNAGLALVNAESATTVFDSTWHHVCWCDNNGSVSLFVDGVLDATSFSYTPATLTTNVAAIMALRRISTGFFFAGRFDDVRVWDQALDISDTGYLYNSGNGRGRVA